MKTKTTNKGTELPLLNLKGKDYLEVKWRLVWFREEHPDWTVSTELIQCTDDYAVCRTEVRNNDLVIATGHKREDKKHFPDFIEKAETGSIGRALALCGYGTQFDGGELAEGTRIVDAPVTVSSYSEIISELKRVTGNWKDMNTLQTVYKKFGIQNKDQLKTLKSEEQKTILNFLREM